MTTAMQSAASTISQDIYAALNVSREMDVATEVGAQDRFLKLLVTQLKNQDPLNPMDNAEMTSQLAQISTVDGIEKLNATLQMLVAGSNENQAMQAAGMIGHGVRVPGSSIELRDGVALGGVELEVPADRVTVTIKDGNGLAIKSLDLGGLDAGATGYIWDGTTDSGADAAAGNYTVSVQAMLGENKIAAKSLQWGVVSSVARSSQGVSLNVGTLGTFNMADVREIL